MIIIIAIIYFVFLRKSAITEPIEGLLEPEISDSLPAGEQVGQTTPGDKQPLVNYDVTTEAPIKLMVMI